MATARATVEGVPELKEKLQKLVADAQRNARNGVTETGQTVLGDMQRDVPILTGALRSSLEAVIADENTVEVGPSTELDYSLPVEFGTTNSPAQPYVTPASEVARRTLPETVAAHVRRGLPQ